MARRSLVHGGCADRRLRGRCQRRQRWADAAGAASAASAGAVDDGGPDEALLRAVLCQPGRSKCCVRRPMPSSPTTAAGAGVRWPSWPPVPRERCSAMSHSPRPSFAERRTLAPHRHLDRSLRAACRARAERGRPAPVAAGRRHPRPRPARAERRSLRRWRASACSWLVADARLAIHRGDRRLAEQRLEQAQAAPVAVVAALPWLAVRTLIEIARARLLLGDSPAALAALAQARTRVELRPELGKLPAIVDDVDQPGRCQQCRDGCPADRP